MRSFLAAFFKFMFSFNAFKKHYFGFYQRIFFPYDLFKGVTKQISYKKNIKIELHLNDWIQQNIYFLGGYEDVELNLINQLLNEGDTFIDIGANIGLYSLVAARKIGEKGKVIAFEPFPLNNTRLCKNVALNNLKNISIESKAVSDQNGSLLIQSNEKDGNQGMASAFLDNYSSQFEVPKIALDEYVEANNISQIDLIKIDIEGGEYLALKGMKTILSELKPTLLIEIDPSILAKTPYSERDILQLLTDFNYKQYFITDSSQLSEHQTNPKRKNYLFKPQA